MKPRSLLALTLLAACAEQQGPATDLDTDEVTVTGTQPDRWYEGAGNVVTIFAGSVSGQPQLTLPNWQALWDAVAVYNQNTAIHMVFGCAGATRNVVASCAIPMSDTSPHVIFAQAGVINGGRTYGRTGLVSAPATDINAPSFLPFLPLVRAASGSRHEDFIIGFGSPTLTNPVSAFVPMHELGHALGLQHEQRRNDAQNQLHIYDCCIDVAQQDAALGVNEVDFKPYDIKSMMEYASGLDNAGTCFGFTSTFSIPGWATNTVSTKATCSPRPSGATVPPTTQLGFKIVRPSIPLADLMSAEDRNMLYEMYPADLGTTVGGDTFGTAVVTGDFDGDGYKDIAIGAPGAGADGAVYVYKGTFLGAEPWKKLVPNDGFADEQFGKGLAVGDVNGDHIADLIVGAPNATSSRGRAWVFHGDDKLGPSSPSTFEISDMGTGSSPQAGDVFGGVIAAGDFDKDGHAEIVLGVPGRHRVFVVDETSPGTFAHYADFGAVQSADFGAALAVGEVSGDNFPDLVIGAPHVNGNGSIMIARSQGSGGGFLSLVTVNNFETNADNFGAAVAVANLGAGGRVVVGEPMWNGGRGRVFVLDSAFGFAGQELLETQFGLPVEAGLFGSAIAAGDTDASGADHIIVGAPNANGHAGMIGVYMPTAAHLVQPGNFFGRFGGDLANSKFGAALAVGNVDKRGGAEVIVGEPVFDSNRGEAFVLHGRFHAPLDYFDRDDPSDAFNLYDMQFAMQPYRLAAGTRYRH